MLLQVAEFVVMCSLATADGYRCQAERHLTTE